jgi:TonB-dependent SusC/RagA subfamily outer membrane receptor
MEEDKLLNQIKSAAENAETKDFSGMDKVWNRVEEKLDKKEDKKAIWRWKKIAVAASLLLFGTLGYQFLKNDQNVVKSNEAVTVTDSTKNTSPLKIDVASAEPQNPEIRQDAEQILQKQITIAGQTGALELTTNSDMIPGADEVIAKDAVTQTETYKFTVDEAIPKTNEGAYNSATANNNGYLRSNTKYDYSITDSKEVELFMYKSSKVPDKKEDPLVVFEDKVIKKKLENIQFSAADSLVVLKEPLYIINGVEYTEQEVFGPKPTSPYTPLTKQDIETISILQNEKATEIYGDKGKNGVVIITTKQRKPVSASTKAK